MEGQRWAMALASLDEELARHRRCLHVKRARHIGRMRERTSAMSTENMKPVTEGTRYIVRFGNTRSGVVLVLVSWVPNHESKVPDPQQKFAATGAVVEATGTVPPSDDARRMVVVADLDPGEEGDLELWADGKLLARRHISATTVWKMLVEVKESSPARDEAST
jgi:hypothetical protein